MRSLQTLWIFAITCAASLPLHADVPEIITATANQTGSGWNFNVTLRHGDEGWDHYADGWGVYDLDGTALGYRVLAHPHVNEQPFTRSLSGVVIPEHITQVVIRPHDLVHGDGLDYILELKQ
ncbi:MAG: hypothetical protein ACI9ZD_001648 [Paracoccaceae bacterium]|jgi:hypothetical protein